VKGAADYHTLDLSRWLQLLCRKLFETSVFMQWALNAKNLLTIREGVEIFSRI
jgi:hypothetical protein